MKFRKPFSKSSFCAGVVLLTIPLPSLAHLHSEHKASLRKTTEQPASPLLWFVNEPQAQAVWAPFGVSHSGAQRLEAWVKKAKYASSVPPFRNSLSLNCWEYVLYTALRLDRLTLENAKTLYAQKAGNQKLSELLGTFIGKAEYKVNNVKVSLTWPNGIGPGDVVFMDETSHVVQLLGVQNDLGNELVISFSPRPIWGDGSQERPVPGLRPEITTVESLIEEMVDLYPDVPTDWENIKLKVVRLFEEKDK